MPVKRRNSHLLRHTEVPARVTESFILSGYRFPNYSFLECLVSAFQPTNETGNFWTHFLAVFVFAFNFLELFWWDWTPSVSHPFFYPFWNYFIGVFGLLMVSSMAHLFNSMSLLIREICFFIDYGTISAYTVGSSLAYFYYIHPKPAFTNGNASDTWMLKDDTYEHSVVMQYPLQDAKDALLKFSFFETFYIPSACLVALICTMACCNTRQRWRRYRYVIRTLVFILPFTVASTPIFYRLYVGPVNGTLASFFLRHCFWLVVSAVFNISKIPERFSPGKFDIWGHSHQWFHFCTFMSILDELHMIKAEIHGLPTIRESTLNLQPALPTLWSTYGVMFALQCCIAGIIFCFGMRVVMDNKKGTEKKKMS
ncbi:membrane progesterone receptor epsilon [Erpetoichthys calabaricus]|uniref:Progestin and adipoQ receptor family member 9 n=1 Tax=Erpetoichthys calabaricus TaxID=27687 RepID=A0A8C4S3A0_ERPCA|nr:membrane progesterone receptor epsilon [Erpetoichthys calabaricus]